MVSLSALCQVSEEGVRFRPPHGPEILLSPERAMGLQNALGEEGGERGAQGAHGCPIGTP